MLLYTFGSAICSFIEFLSCTECQASRISLCHHVDDLSMISTKIINKYTVKNSASFVKKIRTLSVDPDKILVSFDVVSLFTCIPTHLAIEVVKERLDSDQTDYWREPTYLSKIL